MGGKWKENPGMTRNVKRKKKKETLTQLNKMGDINNEKQPGRYFKAKFFILAEKNRISKIDKRKKKENSIKKEAKEKLIKDSKNSKAF